MTAEEHVSTRRIQFFIHPREFDQIVTHWRQKLSLNILVPQDGELLVCHDAKEYYQDIGFFLADRIPASLLWNSDVIPAKLGWIDVMPPMIRGKALLKAQVAYKSDWYDSESEASFQNDALPKLFKVVSKPIREILRYPIWGKNVAYNTAWEACRDIGYSPGAAEWENSGGELRQNAVKNILFSVSPDLQSNEA
jgi:hypothetical protein